MKCPCCGGEFCSESNNDGYNRRVTHSLTCDCAKWDDMEWEWTCGCGEVVGTAGALFEHWRGITDWKSHVTLGVLKDM